MKLINKNNITTLGEMVNAAKPESLDDLYRFVFAYSQEMNFKFGCGPVYETREKITGFNIFNSVGKKFMFNLKIPIKHKND